MSTPTKTEVKIAGFIYNNLGNFVSKAATHPILCRLNLHNNRLLKKINNKAGILYRMATQEDALVKAPYYQGGEDNTENALMSIKELICSEQHYGYKDFIFKRINFLVCEAMSDLYNRNHQEWVQRINAAIHAARPVLKAVKKPLRKVAAKKSVKTKVAPKKKAIVKPKKVNSVKRLRDKKGRFISRRR
jgi:hypothetical protein